jgi:hypothetical protein
MVYSTNTRSVLKAIKWLSGNEMSMVWLRRKNSAISKNEQFSLQNVVPVEMKLIVLKILLMGCKKCINKHQK